MKDFENYELKNPEFLQRIESSLPHIKTEKDFIEALIEAEATEKDKDDINYVFTSGKWHVPFDIGDTGVSFDIWVKWVIESRKRKEKADEKTRREKFKKKAIELKTELEENLSKIDSITSSDLAATGKKIVKITEEMQSTVKPSKVDYSKLLTPTKREDFITRIKNKPPALKTSYRIDKGNLRFQTGALSVIAAPTGHGKTTFLINLLLDAVALYPNKRHWLFSYEEDETAILIKTLNAFCDYKYSTNNKRTIESGYRGNNDYFGNTLAHFKDKEKQFWEMVDQGAINIVQADYSTEELMKAIKTVSGDNAGFIGIDYLQMLYTDNKDRYTTRQEELKRVCLDLKDLAIDTGLAIVAAGQFNRQVTGPGAMESQKIADASDIEKAANKVLGLWNGDKKPLIEDTFAVNDGQMYLKILKSRDGKSDIDAKFPWDGNRGVIGCEPIRNQSAQDADEMFKSDNKTTKQSVTRGDIL